MGKVNFDEIPLEEALNIVIKFQLKTGGVTKLFRDYQEILKRRPDDLELRKNILQALKVVEPHINKDVDYD